MESSFHVIVDAFRLLQPNLRFDPLDLLRAFDVNRDKIYTIAALVYARGRRGLTTLTPWMFDISRRV